MTPTFIRGILIVAAATCMMVCPNCQCTASIGVRVAEEKVILSKEAVVERLPGEFSNASSVTVFYLIAEDGTCANVGLSDYSTHNAGDTYSSTEWRRK